MNDVRKKSVLSNALTKHTEATPLTAVSQGKDNRKMANSTSRYLQYDNPDNDMHS